jgi:hypothetical protein
MMLNCQSESTVFKMVKTMDSSSGTPPSGKMQVWALIYSFFARSKTPCLLLELFLAAIQVRFVKNPNRGALFLFSNKTKKGFLYGRNHQLCRCIEV